MGVLTSGSNGQSFSAFVMFFGVLLLICSSLYLKHLQANESTSDCGHYHRPSNETKPEVGGKAQFCENVETWKTCAIVGIVIGCIDLFLGPVLCCCVLSAVCGVLTCMACLLCCFGSCLDEKSSSSNPATQPLDPAITGAGADGEKDPENPEDPNDAPQPTEKIKSDIERRREALEKKLKSQPVTIGNNLFQILLALAPLIGTTYIFLTLYSTEAIRTDNDKLYKWSLSLFVMAVLNSMLFAQKLLSKLCGNVLTDTSKKVSTTSTA